MLSVTFIVIFVLYMLAGGEDWDFWRRHRPRGSERLFYGYPVFFDDEGFLSPLFVAEVEVEPERANRFSMRPANGAEPRPFS